MFNRQLSEEIQSLVSEETKDLGYAVLTSKNELHLEGIFTPEVLGNILERIRSHTDSGSSTL